MKFVFTLLAIVTFILGYLGYQKSKHLFPLLTQLTQERIGTEVDLQPKEQKEAHFVGSSKCLECHEENHKAWSSSRHPKMLQNINSKVSPIVADFLKLPADANFQHEDIAYTVGGKFKQRFMIRKDINNTQDYILGNYQWNVQTQKWQDFKPWKYWYKDAHPNNSNDFVTSKACDGCHFTGFMSREQRIEPGISCESCHGPGSKHIDDPNSEVFVASMHDPVRQNEVCLQCHMRNRDTCQARS